MAESEKEYNQLLVLVSREIKEISPLLQSLMLSKYRLNNFKNKEDVNLHIHIKHEESVIEHLEGLILSKLRIKR